MDFHQVTDVLTGVVTSASILNSVLPPYERFKDWPRFQGFYKFFLVWVEAAAINLKSSIYPSIQTQNPNGGLK